MDHNAIQAQLFALYDGELTGSARGAVESHLLDCTECRALLADWKRVVGACFQSPEVSSSEALVQCVMQRIARVPPQPFRVRLPRWIVEGGWLAPAIGLVGLGLVVMQGPLQQTVSIETLLLSDGREPAALQQVLTEESPSGDEIFGLLMEDAS